MNLVLKDDNSGFIDGDRPDRRRIGQRDQPSSKALSSQHLCRPSNFSQQGLQRGQFIFSKNKNLGVVNPVPHRAPLGRGVFRAQARLQQCKSPPGSRASGVPSLSLFLCVSPPSSDCLSLSLVLSFSFSLFLSFSFFVFCCRSISTRLWFFCAAFSFRDQGLQKHSNGPAQREKTPLSRLPSALGNSLYFVY